MKKSDAPLHVKYLQTMVECLCILGKVAAAGAIIWFVVQIFTLSFCLMHGFDRIYVLYFI